MPHRHLNHDLAQAPRSTTLPSLIEDDEEEEDFVEDLTGGTSRRRTRQASYPSSSAPLSASTSQTSRNRPGARPIRHQTVHSSPSAPTTRSSRTRAPSAYSQFNQRYRQQHTGDVDDATSFYTLPGHNSDSDDDESHSRRTSGNSADVSLVEGMEALGIGADDTVEAETPEDMQRLEWQTMLASVLGGEVLRSEKTRIGRALESYEEQRINRLDLWQELRAFKRGRTIEQEKAHLEERRRRVVGPLIEELQNWRYADPETEDGLQSDQTLEAMKQVASLLRRWDAAETLYPHSRGMRQDYPECGSEEFVRRLDTLTSWYAIVTSVRHSIQILKQMSGSETLDITHPMHNPFHLVNGTEPRPSQPRTPDASQQPPPPPQDGGTFIERILKEDSLQRTFERGALIYLHAHVENARTMHLDFSDTLNELNLPAFTQDLIKIIRYPTRLMEEVLRVRLSIAQQVLEPSMLSVDQMLDDFRLAIGLACTLKSDYEQLMRPDPEGRWNLPPCIAPSYEETLLAALRFFFKLIHSKLKSSHQGIYFKETELLEAQWNIMEEVAEATEGGALLVAEHVS